MMRRISPAAYVLAAAVVLAGCAGAGNGTGVSGAATSVATSIPDVLPTDIPAAVPTEVATAVSEAAATAGAVLGGASAAPTAGASGTPNAVSAGGSAGGVPGVGPVTRSGVVPPGWTRYTDPTGQCGAAVPPGWGVNAGVATGSPDGTVSIYLNGAPLRGQQEFDSAKGLVKMNTPTGRVLQDDAKHLLLVIPATQESGDVTYHYVVDVGQASCYMVLGLSTGGTAANGRYVQQILESVGPGR